MIHRQTANGIWKDELWTLRDFGAQELIFAPLGSQVKDTHLTQAANAPLCVPKHGPGKHPSGLSLAMDGRGQTSIAKEGSIDSQEHKGVLYWLVQRTSDSLLTDMSSEAVAFDMQVSFALPPKKRKLNVHWESHDVPTVPILVNRKAIKQHTRLACYLPEKTETPEKKTQK